MLNHSETSNILLISPNLEEENLLSISSEDHFFEINDFEKEDIFFGYNEKWEEENKHIDNNQFVSFQNIPEVNNLMLKAEQSVKTLSTSTAYKHKNTKIFNIKKVNLRRKIKRDINSKRRSKHTREAYDNIISNIKNRIINNVRVYINNFIKKTKNTELNRINLKNINKLNIPISSKKNKLELLDMSLRNIFSQKISPKYKELAKKYSNYENYNKIFINRIYNKKEKDLINILDKTFREIIEIYNGKRERDEIFKDFITLENDIVNFEGKEKRSYIDNYKYVAENFVEIIEKIDERSSKKLTK